MIDVSSINIPTAFAAVLLSIPANVLAEELIRKRRVKAEEERKTISEIDDTIETLRQFLFIIAEIQVIIEESDDDCFVKEDNKTVSDDLDAIIEDICRKIRKLLAGNYELVDIDTSYSLGNLTNELRKIETTDEIEEHTANEIITKVSRATSNLQEVRSDQEPKW